MTAAVESEASESSFFSLSLARRPWGFRLKRKRNEVCTSHCGLQNHPERIKKLLAALELTAPLAEISALAKATKAQGKCKADTELMDLAPASLVKLDSEKVNGDVTKLSKKGICAVSFRFFGCMYKEAK